MTAGGEKGENFLQAKISGYIYMHSAYMYMYLI